MPTGQSPHKEGGAPYPYRTLRGETACDSVRLFGGDMGGKVDLFSINTTYKRCVIPAKAGIQCFTSGFRIKDFRNDGKYV
jgi:hypothetical protein